MTVREMHIELDQSLQQVAAHRTRKYQPEEKDWVLNKMQNRFIQSCIRPKKDGSGGFEIDQLGTDVLRNLIVTGSELVPYIDPSKSRYKCFLPSDYNYLLTNWSYSTALCTGVEAKVEAVSLDVYTLRQTTSDKGTSPFYETIAVNLGEKTVTIPDDLPYGNTYTGYKRKEDISFIIPWITSIGSYYWEQLDDVFKPKHYLIVVPGGTTVNPELTVDGTTTSVSEKYTWSLQRHTNQGVYVENRLLPSNKIPTVNTTQFYKTSHYSPISELKGNTLYVYYDSSFTVNKVGITYIRKALPISLSLGTDSELPESFHQQICDLAVEYLKGRLENVPGQQLAENDNNTRVVL